MNGKTSTARVSAFDLNGTIDAIVSSGETDIHAITNEVTARVPVSAMRDVLGQIMPHAVRIRVGILRRRPIAISDDNTGDSVTKPSPSMARFGDHYEAARRLVYVPGVGMVDFRAMDAAQCELKAADYRRIAGKNEAYAVKYEKLARTMKARKAATVADLPVGTVKRIMG